MNIRNSVILLLVLFVFSLICRPLVWAETVHTVKKGETLYSIARQYGVPYQAVLELNKIADPSKIYVGQKISIPDKGSTASENAATVTSSTSQTYRVKRGDTLFNISRTFSVTVDAIRKANNLTESSVLKEGMVLTIPGKAQPATVSQSDSKPGADTTEVRSVKEAPLSAKTQWPVTAKSVSYLTGKLFGVVITAETDEQVRSLSSGTVVSAGPYRGFGKVAIIQAANGYLYVYGGCDMLTVKEGDAIKPGTILGRIGIDSISKQPQLYFLVYKDNKPIDPLVAPRG
ncbi:M23 family metallopeptidase [Gracilinema caldarium]|uniref:M23 family metallopeptidase n=1 Tax=Gracilinema caldarium TaxID=215591 RepID=UPI0026ECEB4F|nr:M23 family metallopeptidase [Gracilinema caldarium]